MEVVVMKGMKQSIIMKPVPWPWMEHPAWDAEGVYAYKPNEKDFTHLGMAGELTPISCVHDEIANGMSEITLVHPLDEAGKYQFIKNDVVLRVPVPVRTTPALAALRSGMTVPPGKIKDVEKWRVRGGASRDDRRLWTFRKYCIGDTDITPPEYPPGFTPGTPWVAPGKVKGVIGVQAAATLLERFTTVEGGVLWFRVKTPAPTRLSGKIIRKCTITKKRSRAEIHMSR